MAKKYISLGPSCISASILKDSGKRSETFGFDWCRSGSIHIEDLFRLSLDEFLIKHAYDPNIQLIQEEAPCKENNFTPLIKQREVLFGYNYLINPHRDYSDKETRGYLKRSFERIKQAAFDKRLKKVYLLADYVNKEHYCYFNDVQEVAQIIESILSDTHNFNIVIIRIHLKGNHSANIDITKTLAGKLTTVIEFSVSNILDSEEFRPKLHNYMMKKIDELGR